MLADVNVALGVTGSIAAVKVVELAHELRRRGASVRGVMTPSAQSIVHPWAVQFATRHPVITQITGQTEHIELCGRAGWADVLLIAPATANTLGKISAAIDDTPVTTCATTAFGAGIPVVIAPAMHEPMYDHPGVLDSIDRVESWGASVLDPAIEENKAKLPDEDILILATARATLPNSLADKHIVITSGATSERIDPIRTITNRASGKTGRAVAKACYALGATVTLVHDGPSVPYATVRTVETEKEMREAVGSAMETGDALVSAAAIGDFTTDPREEKIRSGEPVTLELQPTPKLIHTIRTDHPDVPIVGFKAEIDADDETLQVEANRVLERTSLAFVVANNATVMGADETRALIVRETGVTEFSGSKSELGHRVARELVSEFT